MYNARTARLVDLIQRCLNAAAHRAALSEEARAHLQEAANTLGLALAAPLVRMGV
jgi:hypothetical protein